MKKLNLKLKIGLIFLGTIMGTNSFGQASLPLSRSDWGSTPTGWTDSGTTTYGTNCDNTSQTNGSGKLDNSGDFYTVNFSGTPGTLSLNIKGEGTSGSYTFRIQESNNGSSWSNLETFNSSNQLPTSNCIAKNYTLGSTSSYVRLFFEVKATGNVRVDDVSITAGCTAPSSQATNFSATNIQTTQMQANWTRGNGDNVLVIARQGSAVATDPTNGVSYTANAAYGSGNAIGTGFVVYNGSGTNVVVTSLAASTTYHYAIYEFNSADYCYNLTQLTGSATTAAPPATVTHTGTSPASSNVQQGTINTVLYSNQVTVATAAATLTQAIATTAGTWTSGDITNFKLWFSTDATFSSSGDQTIGTVSSPSPGDITFTVTPNQAFPIGTRYLFITCDVAAGATINNTVGTGFDADNDLTYSTTPTFSGSTFASPNVKTIIGIPEIQLEYPINTNVACGFSLAFGNVIVGSSTSLTVRIRNVGTGT